MNRGQRRVHRQAWLVIVPLAIAIVVVAYGQRPTAAPTPVPEERR